jgi:hypothetical protein
VDSDVNQAFINRFPRTTKAQHVSFILVQKIKQSEELHPTNWNSANTYGLDKQRNTRHTTRNPETLTRNVTFIHATRDPQKNATPYKEH